MAKSPDELAAAMLANLKEKTGKTLSEWREVAASSAATKHGELVKFLKTTHNVTHGYANLIVHEVLRGAQPASAGDDLVAQQYAGAKADLKPIYNQLLKAIAKFGEDVEVAPKKSYVSLRRHKQFALIQPSTKTRVDVGINLKDVKPHGRLEPSGSFNAMVSHRVRVAHESEVDQELIGWLKEAYEQA